MTAKRKHRELMAVLVGAALVALATACAGDDGAGQREAQSSRTKGDVASARREWARAVNAACAARDDALARIMRDLPGVVERGGLGAAASRLTSVAAKALVGVGRADPAPGDEAAVREMERLYRAAFTLEARAIRAPYERRDRRFYALMAKAREARAAADAIARELGARRCAVERAGPYASVDELAAVRWGDRASKLCRARDRAFGRLRSTDLAGFDAVSTDWLRRMRALALPRRYARTIDRFLNLYAASLEASRRGAYEESNRLTSESTDLMYDVGFTIGFHRFCSARPA